MRQGLCKGPVYVRPSVCPIYRPLQQRSAGLPRAGNIDRLLHGAPPAAAAPQQHGERQNGGQRQM